MLKPKQRAFLAAYAKCGIVAPAARAAKCARSLHYDWLEDEEYARAAEEAKEHATQLLEDGARKRALKGTREGVYYKGKRVGYQLRYSDNLTMFLLKAARPEKYRDNAKIEHTGANGGPLEIQVTFVKASTSTTPD